MSNNVTKLPSKSYIDFRLLERCSCICDRQTGPGLTSMQEKSHWISLQRRACGQGWTRTQGDERAYLVIGRDLHRACLNISASWLT